MNDMADKKACDRPVVPIWEKATITIEEAVSYTGIGLNKMRELTADENCDFVLWVGSKRIIKRKKFEEYLDEAYSI